MSMIKAFFQVILFYLILVNLAFIHLQALTLYIYAALSFPAYFLVYLRYEKRLKPSRVIHGIIIAIPLIALMAAVVLNDIIL